MAAPPRPARDWFMMPPPDEPVEAPPDVHEDQTLTERVYGVLREHVAYSAATRAEIRQARREIAELKGELMKVSELSSKVDELVNVANDIKSRADSASSGGSTGVISGGSAPQEDDPEVQRLADRIDSAIKVLKGEGSSSSTMPTPSPIDNTPVADPNAPVEQPAQPDPAAQATDINSPA